MDKAKVLNRVYASSLPSRAKTVMFYLVNRSNKELTCFPAIPTIARETGLSERTVQRALKELCEEGYVEKSPRYRENGGQSSNLYILLIEDNKKVDEYNNQKIIDKHVRKEGGTVTKSEKVNMQVNNENLDILDEIASQQGMCVINFHIMKNAFSDSECHRVGDICVPP